MSENSLILIADAYSEPHRKYHTLEHLNRMFSYAKENNIPLNKKQKMAIWFHDICYHIPSKQKSNEESSADLAYILTYKEFGKEGALDIKQMILDTEKHLPTIEDSKIVIDLDLIDLAYKDRYVLNGLKLREEYKQLSDEEWKKGRIKWLKTFLGRQTIFVSKYCSHLETDARNNLNYDLNIEINK